jgi:hypothetical protein
MTYTLTFSCSEPGCDKTVVLLCDAKPTEAIDGLRRRNPLFQGALCGAKHSRDYSAADAITVIPDPGSQKLAAELIGEVGQGMTEPA